jgi:hypothetical protein
MQHPFLDEVLVYKNQYKKNNAMTMYTTKQRPDQNLKRNFTFRKHTTIYLIRPWHINQIIGFLTKFIDFKYFLKIEFPLYFIQPNMHTVLF